MYGEKPQETSVSIADSVAETELSSYLLNIGIESESHSSVRYQHKQNSDQQLFHTIVIIKTIKIAY
jgi:hypothetical protein